MWGAVMDTDWSKKIKSYRLRHGVSQTHLAELLGVSQRTISRWERGDDNPGITQQKKLRDLGWETPSSLMENLACAVAHCPAPRALCRTQKLNLLAISKPALDKRPSMQGWLGRDLAEIADGLLLEMFDDRELQRSIAKREVSCVITTSRSVLKTPESEQVGMFRTTVSYFFHEGTLFSDAISAPTSSDEICGYKAVSMDDLDDTLISLPKSLI